MKPAAISASGRRADTGQVRSAPPPRPPGVRWVVDQDEAAQLVGVRAGVLEAWRARFGFPRPRLFDDDQAFYSRRELIALRHALDIELSIPAAIAHAQDASGPGRPAC